MAGLEDQSSSREAVSRGVLFALLVFSVVALVVLLEQATPGFGYSIGPNYRNVSVDTHVNITNAGPEIIEVTMSDPITLTAGNATRVQCNITVRDYNGFNDIDEVNATFFHSTSSLQSANDNNTRYTNASCLVNDQYGYYANYSCSFDVYYYAEDGVWNCTAAVNDSMNFVAWNYNNTNIDPLYALNVSALIDYGKLAVGNTSLNKTADVTNLGNVDINVSVYGYGATPGDGLAFVCDYGNIPVEYEHFSANITDGYMDKINLSSSPQQVPDLTVPKQTLHSTQITNTTYWQLHVAGNPFGICNGTVVFQAESSV